MEALAVKFQSLLEAVDGGKLGVAKALGAALGSVLDNADTNNLAVGEKIGHIFLSRIVGKIAEMSSVWWLGRKLGGVFALLTGVACAQNVR